MKLKQILFDDVTCDVTFKVRVLIRNFSATKDVNELLYAYRQDDLGFSAKMLDDKFVGVLRDGELDVIRGDQIVVTMRVKQTVMNGVLSMERSIIKVHEYLRPIEDDISTSTNQKDSFWKWFASFSPWG